jgi:trigger factor
MKPWKQIDTPKKAENLTETTELETAAETQPHAEVGEHTHDHDHSTHDHTGHDHRHEPQPTINPELMREVNVEVDAETVSKAFRRVVKKYQKLARIPGFRVGKVPETVIKSRFGKDVRQEVLDELISERFREAIQSQGVHPVSQPQVTNLLLEEGAPLTFKAAFEVLPEIDVTGYDAVQVHKPDTALSEEEFEAELARVMDAHGTVEPVEEDRELRDGDWAEIEFKGEIQDLAQTVGEDGAQNQSESEPITGTDVLIEVGGKNTLPAFNEALRGAKAGQEMTFEVTYPMDFGEPRLAGQTVKYDLTVKALKSKSFPEKDDELARQIGNYESWADFEQKLREHASGRKKDALENRSKEQMLEQWISRFQLPVPETFVQQQIDARLDRGLRALAQQGMTADDMRKLNFAQLRAAQREQAVNEVKASLILDRIAEREGIEVTSDELDRELLMASLQARQPLEAMREQMLKDGSFERMREQMRREKTGTVLYEKLAK